MVSLQTTLVLRLLCIYRQVAAGRVSLWLVFICKRKAFDSGWVEVVGVF